MMLDVERLRAALRRDFPAIAPSSDRAWSRAPALRVIDCVLSLRRSYDRFLVPRLDRFEQRFPQVTSVVELQSLVATYESAADFVGDALNYNDPGRAQVLSAVIDYVAEEIIRRGHGSELDLLRAWATAARPADHKALGIRGFGLAGFQYLRMLFGANTTKPDVHICGYVSDAVGRRVTDVEALNLLENAAGAESLSLRDLDTTIWEHSTRPAPAGRAV